MQHVLFFFHHEPSLEAVYMNISLLRGKDSRIRRLFPGYKNRVFYTSKIRFGAKMSELSFISRVFERVGDVLKITYSKFETFKVWVLS